MNAKEFIKKAEAIGWYFERMGKGDHKIYKHPNKNYHLSIPDHGKKDIALGTLNKLLKHAGLK